MTWAIAVFSAVGGGVFLGAINGVDVALANFGLKALPVVLIGGLESVSGCVVAGFAIGILETVAAGYLDPLLPGTAGGMRDVFPYILMIVVLIFKPYGLFGLKRIERI